MKDFATEERKARIEDFQFHDDIQPGAFIPGVVGLAGLAVTLIILAFCV